MVAASLADQGLLVSWLPEMLTAHMTTVIAVCVITFKHGSGKRHCWLIYQLHLGL